MKSETQTRTYKRTECAVFSKTKEAFGGLSNMAAGFPLRVNGVRIRTSEALYQACRFPHLPDIQRQIIDDPSPMTAKMKSKPYRQDSRPDWDRVRVKIMRWCLRVKLAQNWNEFSRLLLATRDRPIVEESRKDDFWGAKVVDDQTLVGMNVLGRLLMELREEIKQGDRERFGHIEPLDIPDFRLYGESISAVALPTAKSEPVSRPCIVSESAPVAYECHTRVNTEQPQVVQASLFDSEQQVAASTIGSCGLVSALKSYPEYKESGLPWVGTIPGHWELIPNRGLVRKRKVLVGKRHGEYRLLSLTKQGVIVRDISTGKGKFSSDMGTSQEVRNGDLVFCLFDVPETPRTVGLSRHDGMITGAYTVFESLGRGSSEYFELFYRAMDDRKLLSPLYSGLRNTIPSERLLGTKTPQPPSDEQAAIVRFLDWANGRLERAIRAKRKVIALLNEQKQAIIHRAVTRGLDPAVSLKPSGIPWLGDIPQHWRIERNLALFSHRVERGIPGLPVLQVSLHTGITVEELDQFGRPKRLIADHTKYKLVRKHDLAYNTMRMWQGAVGVSATDGLVSPAYVVIRPRTGIDPQFYEFVFRTAVYKQQVNRYSTGIVSDRNRLYWESFKQMPNVLLPIGEQEAICRFIERETTGLNFAVSRLEREIELLREYRTRLVANVVTGKLDVRAAAAQLPAEAEVPEPLADADDLAENSDDAEGESLDTATEEIEA